MLEWIFAGPWSALGAGSVLLIAAIIVTGLVGLVRDGFRDR